jgi:hypothetical protein
MNINAAFIQVSGVNLWHLLKGSVLSSKYGIYYGYMTQILQLAF